MHPIFYRRHREEGTRFEFEKDLHWNQLGHSVVAESIRETNLYLSLFGH